VLDKPHLTVYTYTIWGGRKRGKRKLKNSEFPPSGGVKGYRSQWLAASVSGCNEYGFPGFSGGVK
jgi:hypothetical protein